MSKTVGYRIIYNIVYRKPNISKIQLKTGSKEKRSACIFKCSNMSDSLQARGLGPARLLCPWDYPSNNTGVGCHFLLQGIFPTQESNSFFLWLLHWQVESLPLSHLKSHLQPNWRLFLVITIGFIPAFSFVTVDVNFNSYSFYFDWSNMNYVNHKQF